MNNFKLEYYKGCTNNTISFFNNEELIFSISGFFRDEDEEINFDKNISLIKELLLGFISLQTKEENISLLSYFGNPEKDFFNPEVNLEEELDLILENKDNLFMMLEDFISSNKFVNLNEDESYNCEQCGDWNFSKEILLPFDFEVK